ncbi:polymer-forming cytoskeletal protein [Natranaerofaba carboxydovora]|uniref:polymer-forming cytoskeletal protein n=1 Tax=Natranaerofaba carboxydovora TaxID=2742683 RepID=UPI001F139C67|nr:polymer-forming cytoskeletal protein [Natranaerofaba carboxydovora]UMZ74803.1 hypothetical protein ACONDI_02406 [Natranaerofaba carboxydovora]
MRKRLVISVFIVMFFALIFQGAGIIENSYVNAVEGNEQSQELERRGEIVKFSGDVHVEAGQIIEGDVVAFSGNVVVDGEVEGDVIAFAGDVKINGVVHGDAITMGGALTVSNDGTLRGGEISIQAGGVIDRLSAIGVHAPGMMALGNVFGMAIRIVSLLGFLVIAFLVVSLTKKYIDNMSDYLERNIGRILLIGLIGLAVFPVLLLAVALTIIGLPLVPFLIIGFFAVVFYGYVALAVLVGRYILNLFKTSQTIAIELIVGYVSLWLIQQLPLISAFIYIAIVIISLGLVIDTKFGTMNPWFKKTG